MAQHVSEDDGTVTPAAPAAGLKAFVVEDEALINQLLHEALPNSKFQFERGDNL